MSTNARPLPSVPLQTLIGLVGVAALHGLAYLVLWLSFGVAMGVAIFGAFLLAFALAYKHVLPSAKAMAVGFVALYVGVVCVLLHTVFPLFPLGPTVILKDVSEAPQHLAAGALKLESKGRTLRQYAGEYTDTSGKYDLHYRVYPVVPSGWKPTEPVPLWEGQEGDSTESDAPSDDVAVLFQPQDTYHEAIAEAVKRFQLTSSPSAPVIYWTSQDTLEGRKRTGYILIFSAYLVWLVLSLVLRTPRPR
jgi:hypothetical protein